MQRVEKEIARLIKEIDYDEVTRLFEMLSGGKRLRAKLILKIAPDSKDAPLLGAVVELIHAASLLHDDVIDEASTRRGVKSVNATDGSKVAVMMGDVLYSKAFTELVAFDRRIARTVAQAVTTLSIGEYDDVKMGESFNEDEEAYLEMIYKKTASLIEATAYCAAILVNKDEEDYRLYGKNLGLSFQIIDDILDIVSDEETLGKPALNDYVEGKCTLPYIYLYRALDDDEAIRLKSYHAKQIAKEDSLWIKAKMKEHKSIERSFAVARKLSDEALEAVGDEPALRVIIESMMERTF